MKFGTIASSLVALYILAGCGANKTEDFSPGTATLYASVSVSNGTATFSGKRGDYTICKTATGYSVTDNVGMGGTSTVTDARALRFSDMTVNLVVGDKSKTLASADLKSLIELYVAFFNRVPDADGLSYWIDQLKAGRSIDQISESFYSAAILYSSLTGYSATMSDSDFVKVIYKNVLGRSGATAPPDADVAYWAGELANGHATKGSLIRTMLSSAHSFAGDATWGWVPQLLDNKIAVADQFAVQQGLNYNTAEESISKTMAIAAAVTPTDTETAKSAIGFADNAFNLTLPVVTGVAAKGPLNNANVTVYSLKADGTKASVLATGKTATDNSGKFSMPLPIAPTGPVQIEVTDGSYISPYNGKTISSNNAMSSIVDSVAASGITEVSVNPLSNMAVSMARSYVAQGYSVSQSNQWADQVVQWQYGLQRSPAKTMPKFDATLVISDQQGVQLGLILIAIDTLGHRLAPNNPDAIVAALASDYADGVFNGKASSTQITLDGTALSSTAGTTDFLKSVAVAHTAMSAGLRPGYVDAQLSAGTIAEQYEAKAVPVYVAQEVAPYYKTSLTTQIPKTVSFDGSATGYSCSSGATLSFDAGGNPKCGDGTGYKCSNGATLMVAANGSVSCSDGIIAMYVGKEIPVYTAPIIKPYSGTTVSGVTADLVVGAPATGTIPVYTATTAHVFTQAERDAMMANDRAAGDLAASKVSGMALNQAQIDAYKMINDLIFVSSGNFVFR